MSRLRGSHLDVGHRGDVVGGGQFEPELVAGPDQVAQFAAGAGRLDPAEHLFDQLAPALAAALAGVPRRSTIDRTAPPNLVLCDVRRHPQATQSPDEVARVVGPVDAQRGPSADAAFEHRHGRVSFGVAAGVGQLDVNHQPVPDLAQQMAQLAEPRLMLESLAMEPRLGVGD